MEIKKKTKKKVVKEGLFEKFDKYFLCFDSLILTGEGIKDLVVSYLVISTLLSFLLKLLEYTNGGTKLITTLFGLGIILIPIYYFKKWAEILFGEKITLLNGRRNKTTTNNPSLN